MAEFFSRFFADTFMPHGYCFNWRADILWINVVSDLLIAVAYFSIPFALIIIIKKRKDLEFKGIFVLFAMFILFCGITHLMSIYNIWNASYGLHGILKAMTAFVSVYTAVVVYKNLEPALAIPSIRQMEMALQETNDQRLKNERLEIERKAEAIFKFATELLPTGLLVIDTEQKIVMANNALSRLFGYQTEELVGKDLACLLDSEVSHHPALVKSYMSNPSQHHAMAAGRVVQGRHRDGHKVDVQISLSVHEFESEKHTFATVSDFSGFTEEQRQSNEMSNRVKRAIDASNDGIWEWHVQTNKTWYSPQLKRMIGREDGPSDFSLWQEHVHPEDWPKVERVLQSHLENKEKYDVTYRGRTQSGDYEWFHSKGNTIYDQSGKPLLMSGTLSNINALKELEDQLSEKTRFLNEVLERSLTGLYIYDLEEARNVFINPEYTHLTGYTLDELNEIHQENSLFSLFHPEDEIRIQKHLEKVIANKGGEGVGIQYRFRHKGGYWRWLFSKDSVYSLDENGKPKQMLGAFFDITDLKEREEENRKLAREYATTFEQAGVGIAHISLDGSVKNANSKLGEILGYKPRELENTQFADVIHEDEAESLAKDLKRLNEGEIDISDTERRYIRKNGNVIWGHTTVSLVENGAPKEADNYYIAVVEDISARKEMENKLSESNSALERFAYSASHDLQEPLRKISAFSGALEKRLEGKLDDPEAKFQLSRICDASLRMGDMIDNLLQLSRASSKPLTRKRVAFSEVFNLAKEDLLSILAASNAVISLESDAYLNLDVAAFSQVVRNLITNSVNYRRADKRLNIRVNVEVESGIAKLRFEDNGSGIDTDKTEQIFEPFRRLVGADIPGTGMGLAICRQIIKAHGGTISALSGKEGAVFIIELPDQDA